ncbi:hypothetical protein Cadr_000017484 [Camelus dromedarius]|uniref:Uncharacterized protein n=1 Tax=Camelus dromedarius TaxID=9838 RepID=A0A5N4DF90_CAMDR|nr:hypothetical protein Cadr_000017484 [Camelus dromedarius]
MLLFHCLHSVNDTSVSLSEGFLLLILHQTGIPAGKLTETQEMQLTTEIHKKSEVFKAVRVLDIEQKAENNMNAHQYGNGSVSYDNLKKYYGDIKQNE